MSFNRNALLHKAKTCFQKRDFFQARMICQELLAANPSDFNALEVLARVEYDSGNHEEAIRYQERCVAGLPRNMHLRCLLGVMYTRHGRYDDAVRELESALRLAPRDRHVIISLADAIEKQGDRERARQLLEPIAALPDVDVVTILARIEIMDGRPEEAVRLLEPYATRAGTPAALFFALGKAYEKLRDGDRAFAAYTAANQVDRPAFELSKHVAHLEGIIAAFNQEAIAKAPRATLDTKLPVFIAGRPRSGTTLLATIIGAHPHAADAGETGFLRVIARDISLTVGSTLGFPEIIRDLDQNDVNQLARLFLAQLQATDPSASRVVDKSLSGHLYLGLIQAVLPEARIIWVRRDAIDNCLACFTEELPGHAYTHDLTDLGATHREFERIMRHWQEILDLPILELHYEELVREQEQQTRRILEFCGLEWDERCLRFYESRPDRPAKVAAPTLSYDQVRRPVYTTSVGRAKLFEKHLGPLLEALRDEEPVQAAKVER